MISENVSNVKSENYVILQLYLVVKVLRYKPAGRGFNSRWCLWNISVT